MKKISLALILMMLLGLSAVNAAEDKVDLITANPEATVSVSSTLDPYYAAEKAIRGTEGNWLSAIQEDSDNQREWLQIDLKSRYNITGVYVKLISWNWQHPAVRNFDIMVSDNSGFTTYETVYSNNGNELSGEEAYGSHCAGYVSVENINKNARYLRIAQTAGANYCFAIDDIQIYGTEIEDGGQEEKVDLITAIPEAKPLVSSCYEYTAFGPDKAIRDTSGAWLSSHGQADSREWFQIDLSRPCNITGIDLTLEAQNYVGGMLRNFDVMISNDPTFKTNTIVHSQGDSQVAGGSPLEITCNQNARYVRVQQRAGATYGLKVADIKVYGRAGEALTVPSNSITLTSKADNPDVSAVSSGMLVYANDDYSAAKLIDGTDTPYLSEQNDTDVKWVQIDLGAPHIITEINVLPRWVDDPSHSNRFEIQLSNDPSFETYAVVHQQLYSNLDGANGVTVTMPDSVNAYKYIRFQQIHTQNQGGWNTALQFREAKVKGLPTTYVVPEGGDDDLTLYGRVNARASSSIEVDSKADPNNTLNYDDDSEWISLYKVGEDEASTEWFLLDLGTPHRLSEIQLDTRPGNFYLGEYEMRWFEVLLSNDRNFQTGVFKCYQRGASVALASAGTLNIGITEPTAYRYIMIRQTQPAVYMAYSNVRVYGWANETDPKAPYSVESDITIVKNDDNTVTASVDYILNTHHYNKTNKAPNLMIAVYDETDGKKALKAIDYAYEVDYTVGSETTIEKTIEIPEGLTNYSVKAFFWSDMGTVNPLIKAAVK